jgi:DtxR family Mn-dependent transcriptional regulator
MQHFSHTSEENYLKALYKLEQQPGKLNNASLATTMGLNPASVLQMVRKLGERKLVTVLKDKSIQLTEAGRRKAIQIIRRHRLWEVFLVEKLGYKWNEVHDIAEQLEHIESDQLVNRLDEFLGFPGVDPHGDPIPDESGRIKTMRTQPLSEAPLKKKLVLVSLADSSDSFLQYMDKVGLSIGDAVEVFEIEDFDGSVTVQHKKSLIVLSSEAARNVLVKMNR